MSPLTVNEVLQIKEPADLVHMSISSNGRWLAFCLRGNSENRSVGVSQAVEGNAQWVCNLETGESFTIVEGAESSWGGVWSPDGETLAFYSDLRGKAQLWLWTPSDYSVKLASDIIVRPFFGLEKPIWTKEGKHIIVKSMPLEHVDENHFSSSDSFKTSPLKIHHSKPQVFTTNDTLHNETEDQTFWENRYRADLTLIDLSSGTIKILTRGLKPVGMKLSSNGKFLAFTNCLGDERVNSQQNLFELCILSLGDYQNTLLTRIENKIRMDYGWSFCWGLDNETIYYLTSGPQSEGGLWAVNTKITNSSKLEFHIEDTHMGRDFDGPISLENGDVLLIVSGGLLRVSSTDLAENQLLRVEGREIIAAFPMANQSENYVIIHTEEKNEALYGFYKMDYRTGECEKIYEEPSVHIPWYLGGSDYQKHGDKEVITFFSQSSDEPSILKVLDVNDKEIKVKSKINKINTQELGTSQIITWKQGDQNFRGALLLPKHRNGKVPVVMRVYAGSMQSQALRLFGCSPVVENNHHLLATRGYAVFLPDLPMVRSNEPAEEITRAIENALDALVEHPEIDSDRIGIIGHSFGGYSALVAITRIQRFKAAVISSGIANLISNYTKFDPPQFSYGWVEDGQANMGTSLWENKDRYIRNSPLFDFDKIQVPVLIVQGTRDHLCSEEAGPMFSALNRLGKTAELILYDEEHSQDTWNEENLQHYHQRVIDWYDKYI
ncbi:prolyl oligopeptidase family serine peptidase [Bacillus sp. E(2018)]|uniref:S9 family peptidase n=1 Tax=Bacillus sp. E(2018) TaxID=2502239 RepID=UPI0010FA21B2|nr:prolyl oligopeptidase family serine peptidase [Bacillus sp. E(2018)]